MRRLILVAVLVGLGTWLNTPSVDTHAFPAKPTMATEADRIAALRQQGPAALQQLLAEYDRLVQSNRSGTTSLTPAIRANLVEMERSIDLVGGQKGCVQSRLFWFTDLEQARAEATKSGRPILSLRMLGNLTDDLSCANSRFFRAVLYSNQTIAQFLRDNFVLHWTSFAPVPRITIEFGDGRTIVRTITGNSIHYVLTSDGQVVDGLPGLYSPSEFQKQLVEARSIAVKVGSLPIAERTSKLHTFHQQQLQQLGRRWEQDRATLEQSMAATPALVPGKALSELQREQHPDFWQNLAALHVSEVQLDPTSFAVIQAMQPPAERAGRLAMGKSLAELPMLRMVRNLTNSIATDTVRNEFVLHAQIHTWLMTAPMELEPFNDRVYTELFLMPKTDPWLGLAPPDVFAALPNGGLHIPAAAPSSTVSQR